MPCLMCRMKGNYFRRVPYNKILKYRHSLKWFKKNWLISQHLNLQKCKLFNKHAKTCQLCLDLKMCCQFEIACSTLHQETYHSDKDCMWQSNSSCLLTTLCRTPPPKRLILSTAY